MYNVTTDFETDAYTKRLEVIDIQCNVHGNRVNKRRCTVQQITERPITVRQRSHVQKRHSTTDNNKPYPLTDRHYMLLV